MVFKKEVETNFEVENRENNSDEKVRGYTLDEFVDKNSPLRELFREFPNRPHFGYVFPQFQMELI